MTYPQALQYISSLSARGWRLGLERMVALCRAAGLEPYLGGPGSPNQYLHVAGTNGKGSTTAYLQSLLVEHGYRTGAFFSPYVIDPRERIQLGRELIRPEDLASLTARLRPIAESFAGTEFDGVSEFEFKTALGFSAWRDAGSQWVALEVGLGGRLDATNVVTPACSIIVSIGMDHVAILGDTHAKIATEKAGIIKPGRPVVVGEMSPEADAAIQKIAEERGSLRWKFGRDIKIESGSSGLRVCTPGASYVLSELGIAGVLQDHNAALAIAAMEAAGLALDLEAVDRGIARARIPGRFQFVQYRGRTLILDGSHNADAARVLRRSLETGFAAQPEVRRSVRLVTNMLTGHDPGGFYQELAPLIESVDVVPVDFPRAYSVPEAVEMLRHWCPEVKGHEDPLEGLHAALDRATPDQWVLVTGSNYLVGEVARAIGLAH